jgi:hypothetical protein
MLEVLGQIPTFRQALPVSIEHKLTTISLGRIHKASAYEWKNGFDLG